MGVLDQLRQHAHNLEIQFRRIADIQADLDEIKRAWQKMKKKKAPDPEREAGGRRRSN